MMPDGKLTALDNKRLLAAKRAGVMLEARLWKFDDIMVINREVAIRFKNANNELPITFGEAVINRVLSQEKRFSKKYPYGSPITGSAY